MKTTKKARRIGFAFLALGFAAAALGGGTSPPEQREIVYQYDALNRLVRAVYDGERSVSYTYDAGGNVLQVRTTPPEISQPRPSAPAPSAPVTRSLQRGSAER